MKRLVSAMNQNISDFIDYKQSLGYEYSFAAYYLYDFDGYCFEHGNPDCLTKEIVEGYIDDKLKSIGSGSRLWIYTFIEFSRYLRFVKNEQAYNLDEKYVIKGKRANPYCLNQQEIKTFFETCLSLYSIPDKHGSYLKIPVYFLLLYCTGIRTFEGRNLRVEDIHLDSGYFDVIKSKNNRDRRIYINDDLRKILLGYDNEISRLYPGRIYFFPTPRGNSKPHSQNYFSNAFRKIWKHAGLYKEDCNNPTPYSFRHHYAIFNILRWVEFNINVDAMMPFLMRSMGHASLDMTYYYLHIIPSYFPAFKDKIESLESRLPEVFEYE